MTATERTVQHTMRPLGGPMRPPSGTHGLFIETDKCVIQVTLYENEDLKIVLRDLTSNDKFPEIIKAVQNDLTIILHGFKTVLSEHKNVVGKLTLDVDAIPNENLIIHTIA